MDEIRGLWRGLERKRPIAVNAKLLPQKKKKKKKKKKTGGQLCIPFDGLLIEKGNQTNKHTVRHKSQL